MRLALLAPCVLGLGLGCGDAGIYGEGFGTPENPIPQQSDEGPYAVTSTIQFTAEALLPAQAALIVDTLRTFADDPAEALLDAAEEAGIPAVGIIRDALPGFLEDRLGGWINDEIEKFKIAGKPITVYAGQLADLAEYSLTQFHVDSDMAIDAYDVTHTLTAIDLNPAGVDFRLPLGGLAGDILTQHPRLYIDEGGSITFGDQHFGLAYGEYVWQALEGVSQSLFGSTIADAVSGTVDCNGLARAIANKCAFDKCVGHETELRQICVAGLTGIVTLARTRFTNLRLDVFRFETGVARLVDDDGDGIGDRVVDGIWEAEMSLGMGLRHAPATFVGTR